LKISIDVEPGEPWELFVNGELTAQGMGRTARTRDALIDDVRRANALTALSRTVRSLVKRAEQRVCLLATSSTPTNKRLAAQNALGFVVGLVRGFAGDHQEHPFPGVSPFTPGDSVFERHAFELGEAMARAISVAEQRTPTPPEGA
jgi:hypothetical protein